MILAVGAAVAVEGGDEAVVAEFEMRRLGLRQPAESSTRSALETRPGLSISKPAGSRSVTRTRDGQSFSLVDLQHDDDSARSAATSVTLASLPSSV